MTMELATAVSESRLSNSFLGNLIEVCVVTRDYRRTMEGLARLGIGPWRVYTFSPETVTEQRYKGQPAEYSIKVCFAQAEDVVWEIMQPLQGPSIFAEFLAEQGEGIHHVAVDCGEMAWDERIAEFEARGFECVQSGRWMDQNSFAFFSTQGAASTVFETYFFPPDFVFPEPEEWYPGPPPG
jgi:methylmalonyl-CoA/ethylmalonyl-CoA epimerase